MSEFWNYKFEDSPDFIETFDELPLWSASFGLLLLKHVEMKAGQTVLDLGSGAGFPLFELAERLGNSCRCIGIDPWANANTRARKKIRNYGVNNVEIIETSADTIPLGDGTVDLIVSNLGINNFDDPAKVFSEAYRVLVPGGKLALTTNLNGHWQEFYDIFEEMLRRNARPELVELLTKHQQHRGSIASISKLFSDSGFTISRHIEEKFEMRFLNGSAFLNHHFVRVGWLSSWQAIIPENEWPVLFAELEEDLNTFAGRSGGLTLTVPMAFIEGVKA